jgi:hypothetical protein
MTGMKIQKSKKAGDSKPPAFSFCTRWKRRHLAQLLSENVVGFYKKAQLRQ